MVVILIKEEDIGLQLVELHNHHVNAAEHAIQTFKNHFISDLCVADIKFPTILWSKLIDQAVKTLNMLHTSRVHQKVSAYQVLE